MDKPRTGNASEAPGPPAWVQRHRYSLALGIGTVLVLAGIALSVAKLESTGVLTGGFVLFLFGLLGDKIESVSLMGNEIKLVRKKVEEVAKLTAEAVQSPDPGIAVFADGLATTLAAETPTELLEAAESAREITHTAAAVGHRAERWVEELERRAGREPVRSDGRRDVGVDFVSGGRRILVKAVARAGTHIRIGQFSSVADRPNFVYIVENLAAPDDQALRIRVIPVELLDPRQLFPSYVFSARVTDFPAMTAEEALAGPLKD